MNHELEHRLKTHLLQGENHIVKVQSQGIKLVKTTGAQKYAFSLSEITQKYDSIAGFLKQLPEKGFEKQVIFTLQKTYGSADKITYHTSEILTHDLTTIAMDSPYYNNTPSAPNNALNTFLGAPELMAKMVDAERAADYREQLQEIKENVKELRSKNRMLTEQNNTLTIKLETAKEREELSVDRALLKKRSFLETPAFEKTMETLGGFLPKVLEAATKNELPITESALGTPLPAVKKAFVKKIASNKVSEEQILFFNYLLDYWKKDLIQYVAAHIEQKQENENYEDTD